MNMIDLLVTLADECEARDVHKAMCADYEVRFTADADTIRFCDVLEAEVADLLNDVREIATITKHEKK